MNLPPETEKILPFLKTYFTKKYNLTFFEDIKPFTADTEYLLNFGKEKIYSQLLLERFLLENFEKGLLSSKLLEILISLETIPGYLFYFKGKPPKNYPFFRIDNLYFYPLFFGKIRELFINLWKGGKIFLALFMELSQENFEPEAIKKELKLQKSLGFTRLNRKAKTSLKEIFELYTSGEFIRWQRALSKGGVLLVSEKPLSANLGINIKPLFTKRGTLNYYFFKGDKLEDILKKEKDSENTLGIVKAELLKKDPFKGINPFLLGYAAFEHAKRAGEKIHLLDGFTLHVLADLFYEWEDLGAALKFYHMAKPYSLQPIELTLSEASIYYVLKDFHKAKTLLKEKLCGCLKEDPRIHYNLGIIYFEEGDRKNAEYHLYKAYLLNEEEPLFRKTLLQFLWNEERYEEMEEILQRVSNLTLEDKIFVGKLSFLRGDYRKALEYLQEILSLHELDGASFYFLSWLYLYFKKDKEASEIFLKKAKELLSSKEFNKLLEKFRLPE